MGTEQARVAAADPWALALPVLAGPHVDAVPALLARVAALRGAGAPLFEVVVGTPVAAYGARLTFETGRHEAVARQAGVGDHPWGPPDWVGLRTAAGGAVRAKAYHRRPPLVPTLVHRGMPATARPVMAALDGQTTEVYAVLPGATAWERFAAEALAPLGCAPARPGVSIVARAGGCAVSVRHDGDELTGITLFATSDALRPDGAVEAEWLAGMTADEAASHRQRVAAAATVSRTPGRRYRMLAWHYTRAGLVSRAASVHSRDVLPDH
ncbi:hypothetical protein [Cellulomonas alba]|uniref:Uncharacterized protein n=1 Tax=Cellulomonas alba TaxID=3053467 RepID=A0ABT7SBB0_9CELL|nr:hypothetical protein [Cellulomonas alba]MDM7853460.1 hypothetical protein [Cellulomonas alba]